MITNNDLYFNLWETLSSENMQYKYIMANTLRAEAIKVDDWQSCLEEEGVVELLLQWREKPENKNATAQEIETEKERIRGEIQSSNQITQSFIVDTQTAEMLKDYDQLVWYSEFFDLYFWEISHYGMSWNLVYENTFPKKNQDAYKKI